MKLDIKIEFAKIIRYLFTNSYWKAVVNRQLKSQQKETKNKRNRKSAKKQKAQPFDYAFVFYFNLKLNYRDGNP